MAKTLKILRADYLAVLISILCATAPCVYGERISYCGLSLSLDSLKSIDSRNVKIKIGSEESIISRENIADWALIRLIKDPVQLSAISGKELAVYIKNCSNVGSSEIVAAFIAELFNRAESPPLFSTSEILSFSDRNEKILKVIIEDPSWEDRIRKDKNIVQIGLLSDALAELLLIDPTWVKARVLRLYYLLSNKIYERLSQKTKDALIAEDLGYLANLEGAIGLLEKDHSSDISGLRPLAKSARELLSASANFNDFGATVAQMRAGVSDKSLNKQGLDLIYPILSSKIVAQCRRFIEDEKLEQALKIFSFLPADKSSPEVLDLFIEISKRLSLRPDIELDSDTLELFEYFSKSGQTFFDAYLGLLKSRFFSALDSDRLSESEMIFGQILGIRPDPDVLNDRLRFEQIIKYQQLGEEDRKQSKLLELRTDLSLYQRAQIVFANRYGVLLAVLLLMIFGGTAFCVFRFRLFNLLKQQIIKVAASKRNSSTRESLSGKIRSSEELSNAEAEEDSQASRFVSMNRPTRSDPVLNEYEECLSKLRLSVSASLKEIKSAYRAAVKECHPDVNPNQSDQQTKKFAEISDVYDKLLELRKQLGMVD